MAIEALQVLCFCLASLGILYGVGLLISESAPPTSVLAKIHFAVPAGILLLAFLFGLVALIAKISDTA